jgi:hypothetical protein
MLNISLITIAILMVCVALLSVGIIFKKNGNFPNTHIDGNEHIRKKGIHCAASQDHELRTRKNLEELLKK